MGKFHSKSGMNLEERMKNNYENAYRIKMPRRMPVILRLDGKSFHTFTKHMNKPFDYILMKVMENTTKYLVNNIQGAVLGYTQSDEISILLFNYKQLDSESWFDNNIQKMVSISAGMASSFFTLEFDRLYHLSNEEMVPVVFDSRTFTLPESEVNNYFISRQNDCRRNAIQMIGQHHYSPKQLNGKKCKEIIEMVDNDNSIVCKYCNYSDISKIGFTYINKETYKNIETCNFKDEGSLLFEELLKQEEK
jgi:tRNA(His) 5'-end guanylyltransferase